MGLDIAEHFIDSGNKVLREQYSSLSSKGKLVVGDMLELSQCTEGNKFTHVLALGSLFYVHDKMAEFLKNVKPHLEDGAVVLIHDFSRNVPLDKVSPESITHSELGDKYA